MEVLPEYTMSEKRERSFTDAVNTYSKRLFGFIRNKVDSREDAEDLLQDVWYRFSRLTNLDELESVSGWLFQVARSRISDFYRKQKPLALEEQGYEDEDGEWTIRDILAATDSQEPEMKQFRKLFWDELLKALDELPEAQREVFVLNELEEMTLQQIADKSGESVKTIISRKGYAVKFLRQRLEYLYTEFINH